MDLCDVNVLTNRLAEFYATTDENRRQNLDRWLFDLQDSNLGWTLAWQILENRLSSTKLVGETEPPLYVTLFALNCLHKKLTAPKFFEQFLIESQEIDKLAEALIFTCEKFSFDRLLADKSCSCLAVYLLKTIPDVFEDAFEKLSSRWLRNFPVVLLNVYGSLCCEFRQLVIQPLQRRANVRSYLRQNEAHVANTAAQLMQLLDCDLGLVEAGIKCVQSWISADGCDLSDWPAIILLCLSKVQQNPDQLISCLAKFMENFVENTQLYKMEKFVVQLYEYAGNLVKYATTLDRDDENFEDIVRIVEQLCSSHTKIFVRLFLSSDDRSECGSLIIDFFAQISSTTGQYPIDETVSLLAVNFWYHLYDEIVNSDDSRQQAISVKRFTPIFDRLLSIVLSKIRFPPQAEYRSKFTLDDREKFAYYRRELADTMTCCYRILGHVMTDRLLRYMVESMVDFNSEELVLDEIQCSIIEAVLFAFESIAPFVTINDPSTVSLLCDYILRLRLTDQSANEHLTNTALRLVDRSIDVIVEIDQSRPSSSLIGQYSTFLCEFVNLPQYATLAIWALLELCKALTTLNDFNEKYGQALEATVIRCLDCFSNKALDRKNRLRALSCGSILMSTKNVESIVRFLNALLAPRLEKLQEAATSDFGVRFDKNELLFEFDVISALLVAFKQRNGNNYSIIEDAPSSSPAYLVISRSLPLFKQLYTASRCDKDVASKLCEALLNSLLTLHLQAESLLMEIFQLLATIYPPHTEAINVSAKFLLIFGAHGAVKPAALLFYRTMLQNVRSSRNPDAYAEFMALCAQMVKKLPRFFDQTDDITQALDLACVCIQQGDAVSAKHACLFMTSFFKLDTLNAKDQMGRCGVQIVLTCLHRFKTELVSSLVDNLADLLFALTSNPNYAELLLLCKAKLAICQHTSVLAMFKELSNKSKFREMARRLNVDCRKGLVEI